MLLGKRVIVVLPAYNARSTIARTVQDIPAGVADQILVVDDGSSDETVEIARELGLTVFVHARNLGYGAAKLSEFHTGYRAFSRRVLETLPLLGNSDDFVFDNQMLAQAIAFEFAAGEISCPTRYFAEASSINLRRSVVYGLGVLATSLGFRLWRWGLWKPKTYTDSPTLRLPRNYYVTARGKSSAP